MSLATTLSAFLLVLANLALSAGASQEKGPRTTNDIHYRMSPVGNTQIRFPRLTAYKDITTMNRVNAQIDELSKEEVHPEVSLLQQVKGVGTQIALTYVLTSEESRGRLFSGVATWPEELRGERATEENQQRRRPVSENDDGAGSALHSGAFWRRQ